MKRILVIEDEPVTVGIWWQIFVREGFQVDIAPDGEAALEMIGCRKPDLIILDLKLPDMDGVKLLRTLRAQHGDLPVFVFTSAVDPQVLEAARAAGADQVLTKGEHSFQSILDQARLALAR